MAMLDFDTLPDMIIGEHKSVEMKWKNHLGESRTLSSVTYKALPSAGMTVADMGLSPAGTEGLFILQPSLAGNYVIISSAILSDGQNKPKTKFSVHVESETGE